MAKAQTKKPAAPPASLGALRDRLNKRYGDQVVRREAVTKYDVISTGSLTLDLAHRVGGYVEGRIHEVVGPEGVGKTTTAIATMIEAQKKYPEKAVGYIDMEQTFDYDWAEALGLDTSEDRFFHIYPDDAEDVSDLLAAQASTDFFSMIVVDSIGGMESKQAFDKDAGEQVMGRNAQVITRMVKRCAVLARKHQVTIILINQFRANISNPQGGDESAGPKAMKYSTTTKLVMSRSGTQEPIKYTLPGDTDPVEIGRYIRGRVVRSKVAVQGKAGEFYLINADTPEYGPVGIDKADEAVTIATRVDTGIFRQAGAWYYLTVDGKEHRFQGRQAVLEHLRSCPDDMLVIRDAAVKALSGDVIEETEVVLEHAGAKA